MKIRTSNRRIPNRPNYITITLDSRLTGQRDQVFRVPHQTVAARLAPLMVDIQVKKNQAAQAAGDYQRAMALATVSVEVAAAVVGVCWFHPNVDLDENFRDYDDFREFGAMAMEELAEGVPLDGKTAQARDAWAKANGAVERLLAARELASDALSALTDDDAPPPDDQDAHTVAVAEAEEAYFQATEDHMEALSIRMDVADQWFHVAPYDHHEVALMFSPLVKPIMDLVIGQAEVDSRADFS